MSTVTEQAEQLAARMTSLGVREEDFDEIFVRSSGHGGQNVNKTSTCVMLVHRPTGLQVKCQVSRQQVVNRSLARKLLLDKIESARNRRAREERGRIEKAKRQKRGRNRAAKQRMLADKRRHAAKKQWRRITGDD